MRDMIIYSIGKTREQIANELTERGLCDNDVQIILKHLDNMGKKETENKDGR